MTLQGQEEIVELLTNFNFFQKIAETIDMNILIKLSLSDIPIIKQWSVKRIQQLRQELQKETNQ